MQNPRSVKNVAEPGEKMAGVTQCRGQSRNDIGGVLKVDIAGKGMTRSTVGKKGNDCVHEGSAHD